MTGQLKCVKEIIFLMLILTISNSFCQDLSSFEKILIQIKNRNSNKCLKRTSLRQSRVVQSNCNPNDPSSLWFLVSLGDSKWKIISYQTDMAIEVRGFYKSNGGVIQMYSWADGSNQKWWINNKGTNYWEIKSTDTNKCMDVHTSSTSNLGGLVSWDCHGGNNQQFSFLTVDNSSPNKFKQGSTYKIRSFKSNKCLQFDGFDKNLIQNDCNDDDNKKFRVFANNDGSYSIKPIKDFGQVADISGVGTSNGTVVHFWGFNRALNQKVVFITAQDEDKYYIRDVNSGKCYDVPGGTTAVSNIQIWECQNNNPNQYWYFDEVAYIPDFVPNTNAYYRIKQNGSNPSLCLTNSRKKATPLIRAPCNNNDNSQLWKFSSSDNGSYIITSYLEAKSIDVWSYGVENSYPVIMWETHGAINQRWHIRSNKIGVYSIKSVNSRKCMQFPSDINENLVSLSQNDCWDFPSQEFVFEQRDPVTLIKPNKPYKIYNSKNQKCIRYNGNTSDITQGDCDGSDATKFAFTKSSEDASYYIQPYYNMNQVIDVSGVGTTNGTKLHAWSINYTWNQKFFLFGYDTNNFYIRDGNSEKCIDVPAGSTSNGAVLQIWDCQNNNLNQSFTIAETPILLSDYYSLDGYIQIMNVKSNKCLAYNFPITTNQVSCNTSDESSFWKFEYNSADNSYFIRNKVNNNVMDNSGFRLNNDNDITGWSKTGDNNQRFRIEFTGASIDSTTKFNFRNVQSNKCLKIFNDQTTSFSKLVGYDCNAAAESQQFKLIGVVAKNLPTNNGYYSLISKVSGQCLKYAGLNLNTSEYTCDQSNSTRFNFVSSTFGSYRLISSSNTAHALYASGSEGAAVTTTTVADNDYQRFFITAYSSSNFMVRHYQSGKCVSYESGSFLLRACNSDDTKQAFSITEAVDEWENIYENGETC